MSCKCTRREFLARATATAAGAAIYASPAGTLLAQTGQPSSRVAIGRDDALTSGRVGDQRELLCRLLDASMQKLTNASDPTAAWRTLFGPEDRIGIKVNTLGLSTQPAVAEAIAVGLTKAGIPAENILIWDRFDVEMASAGYKINKSTRGVQCRGTDAEQIGAGYESRIEGSGQIGSCFSQIVARELDKLICVPVLKDHNLAGVSLGMKNFYGAIHNPNKYHDHNCDPYIVDVVSHRYIRDKWCLTVCDATGAQVHAGPGRHPGFAWPFGGLIVSTDVVAADAVAASLLEEERQARGLKALAEEGRPTKHITTAATRGLGVADLNRIERIEV